MKPLKVEDEDIKNAIFSGDFYIQIVNQKFLLFEVDQVREPDVYEVTDFEEEKLLLHALEKENQLVSDEEVNRILDDHQ